MQQALNKLSALTSRGAVLHYLQGMGVAKSPQAIKASEVGTVTSRPHYACEVDAASHAGE